MKTYLIALLSGGLGVFAFSPFDLWGVAYLSLLGLIWVVKTPQKKCTLWRIFMGLELFWYWRQLVKRQHQSIQRRATRG